MNSFALWLHENSLGNRLLRLSKFACSKVLGVSLLHACFLRRIYHLYFARKVNLPACRDFFVYCSDNTVDVDVLHADIKSSYSELDLAQSQVLTSSNSRAGSLNKVIWMYWNSGYDNAPEVVKLAHRTWVEMNPGYEVRMLDDVALETMLDLEKIFYNSSLDLPFAHKSDFLRTFLLASLGGVWVDSTSFCWKPLSEWLEADVEENGFFVFRQSKNRPDRQMANWFIASTAGHPIIVTMFDELCAYLFKDRELTLVMKKYRHYMNYPYISRTGSGYQLLEYMERRLTYPYHFYHYLFNEVVSEGECAEIWRAVEGRSNHYVGSNGSHQGVYVSKQSYKGKYPSSETYLQRKTDILIVLDAQREEA